MTEVEPYPAEQQKPLNVNRYATKKTIAQGMLDIALLTANASQLKYVLQAGDKHPFYALMITLISISIILQVISGMLALSVNLLRDARLHVEDNMWSAHAFNHGQMYAAILITFINIIIASFDPTFAVNIDPDIIFPQTAQQSQQQPQHLANPLPTQYQPNFYSYHQPFNPYG